ncbi:hypothetical protein [Sphingomonas fuzhouensis]|uniref:hypothetical protein n=1 Tax=Sphingomonas fuzhouensis TaxID=3106033 RepID=UPI002AFF1B4D|nr:hypothetical protein [Sphingomonas sp. SGZ-02]
MSLTHDHRKVRAGNGNRFPLDPGADVEATFATVVADALRRDFGHTPAHAKHIARLTGTNLRTVQNWLQAKNGPSGSGLVILMRHSDEVMAAVLDLADRDALQRAAAASRSFRALRLAIEAVLPHLPQD